MTAVERATNKCKNCVYYDSECSKNPCIKCIVDKIAPSQCNGVESCRRGQTHLVTNCEEFVQKTGWDL